jgi:hypothetical protein
MAKKQSPESPQEQAKRFEAEAQKLIDAGELDPIEAERELYRIVRSFRVVRPPDRD